MLPGLYKSDIYIIARFPDLATIVAIFKFLAIIEDMETIAIPVPSDARWCIYVNNKKPTGEVGHICKSLNTVYFTQKMFNISKEDKVDWRLIRCIYCKEEIPEDLKTLLRLIIQ